jgi:glutaminyl-tRNA synthetase
MDNTENTPSHFIKNIIDSDLESKKHDNIITRFPPEPNGYLHIGHAKSICLNFGMAKEYGGSCHLRFDDTNPLKETPEYVNSIKEDVKWLGFDWGEHLYFASDYFDEMYKYAVELINKGKAYVCSLNADEIRKNRGTLTEPGKDSPYRDRSVEENLALFEKMRTGDCDEGAFVLRAKIDMASPNINMRDPIIYRVLKEAHHHTGDKWNIYPMYDYAHCLEDMIENITHSLCTLEFEDHRPLYDWVLDQLNTPCHPQQIEFARLNLTYTVLSKRKLIELVEGGHVSGWDDPRMPTIAGLRRRGYTPSIIQNFCDKIGISKANSTVDMDFLNFCTREEFNKTANRVMAVLDPVKVVLTNYPEDQEELLDAKNNPEDESAGIRQVPFSRELYIEREDFREEAHKKFFRLAPGKEVRFQHAYYIKLEEIIKDENGNVIELHCTYDPATKGGWSEDGRKVKGTLHWVSAKHAVDAEVRLYDHLFCKANPYSCKEGQTYLDNLNPSSLTTITAKVEPGLAEVNPSDRFQFLRKGYFCADAKKFNRQKPVFNRIVPLRDTWAKIENKAS